VFRVAAHVWRTTDGRLVPSGDPDAAFLAYPAGSEFSDQEAARRGLTEFGWKAKPKAADKAAPAARNKSGLAGTQSTTPKE
jgi:hypothetical protein